MLFHYLYEVCPLNRAELIILPHVIGLSSQIFCLGKNIDRVVCIFTRYNISNQMVLEIHIDWNRNEILLYGDLLIPIPVHCKALII